jgi:hypothetical protein
MKTLKIIPILFLLFFSCNAQEKKQERNEQNSIKPDENVQVNKEYDEFGNLIRYDSVYSYSYSSNEKMNDSLKMKFQRHFNNHSLFNDSFFNDFFKRDSISGDFNHKNFFFDGFMNQDEHIKSIMKRMDSIQQLFFDQHQRSIIPSEPKKSNYNRI